MFLAIHKKISDTFQSSGSWCHIVPCIQLHKKSLAVQ